MELPEPYYYQILSGGNHGDGELDDEEIQREFAGLEVLQRESDDDLGSKFLERKRQELIIDPVRAEAAAIFAAASAIFRNGASFLKGDFSFVP